MELLLSAQGMGQVPGAGRCLSLATSAWELRVFLCTGSHKRAITVLHLVSNCVKNSKAYLHLNHLHSLLLGCCLRVDVAGVLHEQPAHPCEPRWAWWLQAFAFLCLPVKIQKKTPANFCFYQKSRFNLIFTGPSSSPPRRGASPGVSLAPGEARALPTALPAHPGQG